MHRIKQKLNISIVRSVELHDELVEARILRNWDYCDLKKTPKEEQSKGNILWENMSKFHVPKEITKKETARVIDERKRGLL